MKIDIPGANFLICNNWACKYNNPNTRTCSYDARIVLNENGRCEILPQGNQPKRKRYKIKGYKNKFFKPMVNINLSEKELNEITQKLIKELQRTPLTIMPKHIEDNIYYMSKGAENDNLKSK